jgi:hypothetical protein
MAATLTQAEQEQQQVLIWRPVPVAAVSLPRQCALVGHLGLAEHVRPRLFPAATTATVVTARPATRNKARAILALL